MSDILKYKNPSFSPEERAEDLLSRMTLREKIAQLDMKFGNKYCTEVDPNHGCSVSEGSDYHWDRLREDFPDGLGYLHDNYSVPYVMNKLQKFFIENSRLGIPVIFTGEALHGISGTRGTILPIPTAWAATFEPSYAFEAGRIIATEARALGIYEVLAPNLDVARDPRWGRTEETFGEDTYLSTRMAVGIVSGHQNGDISKKDSVISEPKHYCVHGIPEAGVNCGTARAGVREIESCYLPVFEAAVKEAGACDVMVSYNSIDGDLMMTSKHYMKDVLKDRFALPGICRSDWGGLRRVHYLHKMAKNEKEAIYLSKKNGLDCQGGDEYPNKLWVDSLEELVNEGRIDIENINESCRRVLNLKFTLGLFENPYTDENAYKSIINKQSHLDKALEIAQKSIILLKNNGILPLDKDKYKKIALIGPSSDKVRLGGYSAKPVGRQLKTIFDILKSRLPDCEIIQCDGCGISDSDFKFALSDQNHLKDIKAEASADNIDKAVEIANDCDLIIFCGGDDTISSGEGRDRCELTLCGRQSELMKKLSDTGKPMVFVMIHGKPLAIAEESEMSDAVLSCWFGGESGPVAICDVLLGDVNPGGKLPFSLPRRSTMIPCYYSMLPGASNEYYEGTGSSLYPFGFGLSYTKFEYSDFSIQKTGKTDVRVRLCVKNVGKVSGDEVVQIYVEDCESTVVTPSLLLKAFKRITLSPNEKAELEFDLDFNAFKLLNQSYEWVAEPGTFRICAASSSRDIRAEDFIELD
ncbi:MAG: glycoside hydrolase family 3 C-terminal domain-containing protein [Clostridia bacterium]|nr:glycoside hydrolase family 3 C-terminal domain-containing protein [Clostridia bacterium]